MTNYSRIQNAETGAQAQNPADNAQRGGIIIATSGAHFKNCKVGVEFKEYHNIYNGTEYGNKSYFSGVTFSNNTDYLNNFTVAPQHASLDGCRGIRFSGCNFINFDSPNMFNLQSMGIKSLNANFTVNNGSTFTNLYHAIDAKRTSGTHTFTVIQSAFHNNVVGIYAHNINNFITQLNTFNIGNNLKTGAATQVGIQTTLCSGFTIEENSFNLSSITIPTVSKWGISTISCGSAPNQIYKNYFTGMNYGNFSS